MHAESDTGTADVNEAIVAFKEKMADRNGTLKRAFGEIRDHVRREVDELKTASAAGRGVIPEIAYTDIENGSVPETARQAATASGVSRRFARMARNEISRRSPSSQSTSGTQARLRHSVRRPTSRSSG